MKIDLDSKDFVLGVAGAGAMGRGIAQVAVAGGMRVRLYDAFPQASAEAAKFIDTMLSRAAEKGRMSEADAKAALGRLEVIENMQDFASCQVVIEAIKEDLDVKKAFFAELEGIVGENAILATNTSSLSVTKIGAACKRPERFAGFHFFNPVPLMKLVEVIDGVRTEPWVCDTLYEIGKRMTREPVRVKDAPGFLVNQVGRGFTIESSHIVDEGIAGTADIDRIMRDGVGFRMGPFELMDLTALDVTHPASVLIYEQFYHEPRYRPSLLLGSRYEAGIFGRKVGNGFYEYKDGRRVDPEEPPVPDYDGRKVWISPAEPDGREMLRKAVEAAGGKLDDGDRPAKDSLILVTPIGEDCTTTALAQDLDPARTLAVDTLLGFDRRRTLMKNPMSDPGFVETAHGLLAKGGVKVTVINDSPGFIAQRVIAMICNIGCMVAQNRVSAPSDIDKGVELGLNYPHGPLEFGNLVGPKNVLRILDAMHRTYGDPRYRPTPWLSRRARLGLSLLSPED